MKSGSPLDLKEACVAAAHSVIAEKGVDQLSVRDVARRLGVSHQAPYKHYANRDVLLSEVIRRCFVQFSASLEQRERSAEPRQELRSLGEMYLRFALAHPLEYRLMFSTPWPESPEYGALLRDARVAFDILRDAIGRIHGQHATAQGLADLDALFVWSAMHGLAGVLQSNIMPSLKLRQRVVKRAVEHIMERVGKALQQ